MDNIADMRKKWLASVIKMYTRKNPLLATTFLDFASKEGFKGTDKELPELLFEQFCNEFIDGNNSLLPTLSISRYALSWLINGLSKYEKYQDVKTKFTQKIINEAEEDETHKLKERIIISLVSIKYPPRSGEIPIESYSFEVKRDENDRIYDMSLMQSALIKWQAILFSNKISEQARRYLMEHYFNYNKE